MSAPRPATTKNPIHGREKSKEPCPGISSGQGSETLLFVDPRGFEPLTPCMPCRCATGLRHGPISSFSPTRLVSQTTCQDYYTSPTMKTAREADTACALGMRMPADHG